MGGFTVPAVLGDAAGLPALPLDIDAMYFELDGTFPNHEANPIDDENMRDLQARVRETGADLGLAFDGDADRCFVVDERGEIVNPSTLTALIASRELAKHPGSTIIHNLITSKAVPEVIIECGGSAGAHARRPLVHQGDDGGDRRRLRRGALRALLLPRLLACRLGDARRPARDRGARRDCPGHDASRACSPRSTATSASGEINTEVADQAAVTREIREEFIARGFTDIDDLDGMTVNGDGWWFNVRPSNTEPLLRLNVEAGDEEQMARVRDEVLAMMRKGA